MLRRNAPLRCPNAKNGVSTQNMSFWHCNVPHSCVIIRITYNRVNTKLCFLLFQPIILQARPYTLTTSQNTFVPEYYVAPAPSKTTYSGGNHKTHPSLS